MNIWLLRVILTCGFFSVATAQAFTVQLQVVPPDLGRKTFDFGLTLEAALPPLAAWIVGARLTLNVPTDATLSSSLQVYAVRSWRLYGNGVIALSGYVGTQLGVYYSPFLEFNDDPPPYIDRDPPPSDPQMPAILARAPIGTFTPSQPLELNALALSGLDAAYFVDDQWSVYAGFELDGVLLPGFDLKLYPYTELDWQIARDWLLALGGYAALGLKSSTINAYFSVFWTVSNAVTLRGDLGWNGVVYGVLRLTVRL